MAHTQAVFGDEDVSRLTVNNPGDETASMTFAGTTASDILREIPSVAFNGVSGEVTMTDVREFDGAKTVVNSLEGLHEALFAGPVLRILFFVSGLMGGGMVATGLVLWTKKRRQKLRANVVAERNLIVIERMNVGVIVGLPIAIAAYFWANRLLPVGMVGRADWEIHILFLTWFAALCHGFARPPKRAWAEQLCGAAAVFVTIPVLNAITTSIHLGNTMPLPWRAGDMALAGVDLWLALIGSGFGYAAYVSLKKQSAPKTKTQRTKRAVDVSAPLPAE
ncbi:MAG: PepSY-associated TM helix domain-containing protein [Pseudomonadota bacterium]